MQLAEAEQEKLARIISRQYDKVTNSFLGSGLLVLAQISADAGNKDKSAVERGARSLEGALTARICMELGLALDEVKEKVVALVMADVLEKMGVILDSNKPS